MLLYHGSTMAVRKPTVSRGRANTDFGKGFYLSDDFQLRFAGNQRLCKQQPCNELAGNTAVNCILSRF